VGTDNNTGGSNFTLNWPSTVVACMIILLIGTITTTAIVRYPADDALKVWAALGSIVGVVTGALVTYFFSRSAVQNAQSLAASSHQDAKQFEARARQVHDALTVAVGHLDPEAYQQVEQHPAFQQAMDTAGQPVTTNGTIRTPLPNSP
jgi:hypothetical protein